MKFIFALLLSLLALVSQVAAQVPTGKDVQGAVVKSLTVSSGLVAGIYIIAGILFVFFGYRLFRIVLFMIGFYIGSALAYIVLLNVQPAGGWENGEWIFFGVSLGVGILFGFLFLCFYKLGIAGLGAFGGFSLAVWLLSFRAGGLIPNEIGRIIFIVILAIAGLVLALFFEKPAIITATSVIGSLGLFIGIDVFAQTGVSAIIISFVQAPNKSKQLADTITGAQYGILAAIAVLAIIGIVVQFRLTRGQTDTHKTAPFYRRAKSHA